MIIWRHPPSKVTKDYAKLINNKITILKIKSREGDKRFSSSYKYQKRAEKYLELMSGYMENDSLWK